MAKFALNTIKYEDIRNQIIDYLNEKNEFSGQFDFAGSNLSYFIDVMSYVTTLMSYNTSHVANNIFLDTSEIRKNVVSIAHQIGYNPKRPFPSSFQGKLIYRASNFNVDSKIIIKSNSPFISNSGKIYSNKDAIYLTYQGNPTELVGDYYVTEGSHLLYQTENVSGIENFSFTISNKNASDYNFELYVLPKTLVESENFDVNTMEIYSDYLWENCSYSLSSNPNIYFISEDITKEGFMKISFGNGVIGRIPTSSEVVICKYIECKGSESNFDLLSSLPDMITDNIGDYVYYDITNLDLNNRNIFDINSFDNNYRNVYNKSFGGRDLESIEGIKFNAPKSYTLSNKIITKNDFIYFINTYSEIKHTNIIGGDELYQQQLGNIFITAVPNFDDLSFLYTQNIYISDELITKVKYDLSKNSIISTNKIFQNPTYLYVDITPMLELNVNSNESTTNVMTQIKSSLMTYIQNNFNKLGVYFRESKISSSIQNINGIMSAYLNISYYLILNDQTVQTDNQKIYLPIINIKDSNLRIIGTTNFTKTISQIIKEDIAPNIDWDIESEENSSILNYNILNILPQDSSLYGKLIHPELERYLYNRDYNDDNVLSFNFNNYEDLKLYNSQYDYNSVIDFYDTEIYYRSNSYVNVDGEVIYIGVEQDGLEYFITFTKFNKNTNVNDTFRVANLFLQTTPNNIFVEITELQSQTLMTNFKIDQSNYVFNGSPFQIKKLNDVYFEIYIRHISNNSYLSIYGTNKLFSVYAIQKDLPDETLLFNFNKTNWLFEHNTSDVYATIKYLSDDVAFLERSHSQLISSNKKFKGFVNSEAEYNTIVTNRLTYSIGDYFIVNNFFYKTKIDGNIFFNKNDVIYIDSQNDVVKATIKRYVSSDLASNLITTHEQGDVYLYDVDGYIMFDKTSTDITHPNFTELVFQNETKSLDASKFLPQHLSNNHIARILIPDEIYSSTGYYIYYYDNITHKLQKPLYVKDETEQWVEISTKRVFDGDIIVYKETNSQHVDGGWYLIENISDPTIYTEANARLSIRADEIITIDYLSDLKSFLRILKLTNDVVIESSQGAMFTNVPDDSFVYEGSYIICVDEINNIWTIFDDDPYTYQFDIINNNTEFPEPLSFGLVYNVKVSDPEISNFRGMTQNVTYLEDQKIVYYDDNSWKKFITPTINYNDLPNVQAAIGDLIQVSNEYGNFENSSMIDAPKQNGNFIFTYNDMLYYTGTNWIKLFPYNIYNNMENNSEYYIYKKLLNDLGYNSDFNITFNDTSSSFDINLCDLYHDSSIGQMNYFNGELSFYPEIETKYNKINTQNTSIQNLFNFNNYQNSAIKVDRIKIKQVNRNTNDIETDFDTLYCQYIVCNVLEPELK